MKYYKADLHIHTVLSPCATLEMSPKIIVERASKCGLDMIAITDHNTTFNVETAMMLGKKYDITVIPGAEVCSAEEAHFLVYFPDLDALRTFQQFILSVQRDIINTNHKIGYQLVVDSDENIKYEVEVVLTASLLATAAQIETRAHQLGGLFIPAHINRPAYSIVGQLGFIPDDLKVDGVELSSPYEDTWYRKYMEYTLLTNSDAHNPGRIGVFYNNVYAAASNFEELKKAINRTDGREVML